MGFKSTASDTSAMLYQLSYEASLEAGQVRVQLFIPINSHSTCFQQGFIAQSVEHCAGITEVMGLNPVRVSEFFLGFICNCSYFITARITSICIVYLQYTHIIFIIYTHQVCLLFHFAFGNVIRHSYSCLLY